MNSTLLHRLNEDKNNCSFFMKRDDLLPFSFGGNKARKAQYFFDDIKKKNADTVVTYGSSSSNHCRIVSNMAKANGLKCYIISPLEAFKETKNSRLFEIFGAEIIKTPLEEVSKTIDNVLEELSKKSKPYFIKGGGHGNLGTKAYVDAFKEICDYEEENNIKFDYIFHASGTGTTQAGLVCGQILKGDIHSKIIGISIARKEEYGKRVVIDSISEYLNRTIDETSVNFIDDYLFGGYGKFEEKIVNTIKEVLKKEGIALNTTYTGKAYCGMLDYIEKESIFNKNILFINTGGLPLFFDDMEALI